MTYKFKYKRRLFYKTKIIDGHRFDAASDRMCLFLPDGSIDELAKWSRYDLKLGLDWKEAVKKTLEAQAGQAIPVK